MRTKDDVPRPIIRLGLKELDNEKFMPSLFLVPVMHHCPIVTGHDLGRRSAACDATLVKDMPCDGIYGVEVEGGLSASLRSTLLALCDDNQQVRVEVLVED